MLTYYLRLASLRKIKMYSEYIRSFFLSLFRSPMDYLELYAGPLERREILLEDILYPLVRIEERNEPDGSERVR